MSGTEPRKQEIRAEAKHWSKVANLSRGLGWGAALIGMFCLYISYRRDEPAFRGVLIVLLSFYLLFQFAVI